MNLVQEKVKQRNVTPNFLRFRSISSNTKEKAQQVLSVKRQEKTIKSKHKLPLNEPNAAHHVQVDAASKPMRGEFSISANWVIVHWIRTAHTSQVNTGRWNRRTFAKKKHYACIAESTWKRQFSRQTPPHWTSSSRCQQRLLAETSGWQKAQLCFGKNHQ
jgi:hypothetical protein